MYCTSDIDVFVLIGVDVISIVKESILNVIVINQK